MRLVINPRNELINHQLCRLVGIKVVGRGSGEDGLGVLQSLFQRTSSAWQSWLGPLLDFVSKLQMDVNRFTSAIEELEVAWNKTSVALGGENEAGEQSLHDLRYLREIWSNYASKVARGSRSLAQFRNQMATGEILPHMTGKGVMLAPVHTVKGLEFEIVFLLGMVDGTFPDYRAVKAGGSALAEEKNDAFVAVTRAKRLLYLTWPQAKFMPCGIKITLPARNRPAICARSKEAWPWCPKSLHLSHNRSQG